MLQVEIQSPDLEKEVDASIQLYQAGEVTLGRASELAGIHRFEFESVLQAKGILKLVEVTSEEKLKEGVSLIKSFHRENEKTEE